jgi:hypothetical protein
MSCHTRILGAVEPLSSVVARNYFDFLSPLVRGYLFLLSEETIVDLEVAKN